MAQNNDRAVKDTAGSLGGLVEKDGKSEAHLSHIVSAQKIWTNKILVRVIYVNPREKDTAGECNFLSTRTTAGTINMLEGFQDEDFGRRVEHISTKGDKYINSIRDITLHVINTQIIIVHKLHRRLEHLDVSLK